MRACGRALLLYSEGKARTRRARSRTHGTHFFWGSQAHGWAALDPDSIPKSVTGMFSSIRRYFKKSAAAKGADTVREGAGGKRIEEGYLPAVAAGDGVHTVEQFIVRLKSPNHGCVPR